MQYPEAIRECWAVHQAFRALGFPAGDIYVANAQNGLSVVLRSQGKEFIVNLCGYQSEEAVNAFLEQWPAFVALSNDGQFDQAALDNIYHASNVMQNKFEFVAAMVAKGILPSQEWS